MAPLSYYWIISFIYLVIEKKGKYLYSGNQGYSSDINQFERFSSFFEIFQFSIQYLEFIFSPTSYIEPKKDMYICSNQVL